MFTGKRWLVRANDKRPRLHQPPQREANEDGVYGLRLQSLAITHLSVCLPGHAAPLVETARTGVAEIAGTEEPPQAFRHGVQELGQVFCRLKHLGGPPDTNDAADHRQQDHAVDHIQEGRACPAGPRDGRVCFNLKQCEPDLRARVP